jgi:hypothetical protein
VVSATDPPDRILGFLDRSRYYFFQVAHQLYSRVLTKSIAEYQSVLSAIADKNEIMQLSDSPPCVALTPRTAMGLPYLQV